jgi:hypothetical protein
MNMKMAKKRQKPHLRRQTATAIVVEEPNKVTTPLLRVIRESLGDNNIGFDEVILAKGDVKFQLSGTAVKAMARDRYSVFPLLQREADLFWLGGSLIFARELANYRLKSVSLIVFKGDAIDETKTALFRAEWDSPEPGTDHAQPHWHVYPQIIDGKSNVSEFDRYMKYESDLNDEPVTTLDADPARDTARNFHYAMASRWHTDGISYHQQGLTNVESVVKWIEGCIDYSRKQLDWLFS